MVGQRLKYEALVAYERNCVQGGVSEEPSYEVCEALMSDTRANCILKNL